MLRAAGVADAVIDERAGTWHARACELYAAADLSALAAAAAPGARRTLAWAREAGHTLGLVTGNLEPVARRKLAAAGLGEWFDRAPGGFGSDAEARAALVPLARDRAGGVSRSDTLVIGDAPGDVACALADHVRCVAVASHFAAEELAGAAALIAGLGELPGVIAGFSH